MTAGPDWTVAGLQAARRLRRARPDLPTLLAVTGAALDPDPGRAATAVGRVAELLGDPAWAAPLAGELAPHESVGVLSLGWESLLVLEAAAFAGGYHWLWADRLSILQGLGYLPFPPMQAPPEQADVVLLPGVAADDTTLWTYVGWADTALRARMAGRAVVAVVHPAARLSPIDRAAYRPSASVVATDLPMP